MFYKNFGTLGNRDFSLSFDFLATNDLHLKFRRRITRPGSGPNFKGYTFGKDLGINFNKGLRGGEDLGIGPQQHGKAFSQANSIDSDNLRFDAQAITRDRVGSHKTIVSDLMKFGPGKNSFGTFINRDIPVHIEAVGTVIDTFFGRNLGKKVGHRPGKEYVDIGE
jgi:hypothetical protein